jgi:hypothetical protein
MPLHIKHREGVPDVLGFRGFSHSGAFIGRNARVGVHMHDYQLRLDSSKVT